MTLTLALFQRERGLNGGMLGIFSDLNVLW
jgi:hypothetical protein